MRLGELNELREKNEGRLASGKHYMLDGDEQEELSDDDGPHIKKRKKQAGGQKKMAVATAFKGIDASVVDKIGAEFDGKQFCVVIDEDHGKKTLVEKQIAELGGDIVQNPCERKKTFEFFFVS
jgi:hypothetical protein